MLIFSKAPSDWLHTSWALNLLSALVALNCCILAISILTGCDARTNLESSRLSNVPPSGPGQLMDLQDLIDQEIATGKKQIVIPPGRYRVDRNEGSHLQLSGLSGIVIDGTGVEMICTSITQAILIKNCQNLIIRGLTVDYDPMTFTQGVIVGMSEDKLHHEIELLEGYPGSEAVDTQKYEIFDPTTRELASITYHNIKIEPRGPKKFTLSKPPYYKTETSTEEIGDRIVIATREGEEPFRPHTIEIKDSKQVTLEEVTLYGSPSSSFGFFELDSSQCKYVRCRVDRRPIEEEWKPLAEPRLRSLNADAFHSKRASIGPHYEDCLGRYMADDGIAINGDYQWVASSDSNRLKVASKWSGELPLAPGDSVELVSSNGQRLDDAKVIAVERQPEAFTDKEIKQLKETKMYGRTRDRILKNNVTNIVILDREVNLPDGSFIANKNALGNGFKITGCTLGPNRSRGILVKSSNGLIQDNHLIGCRMEAIKVSPEVRWLEAGSSQDLTIIGNRIENCHDAGIRVTSYVSDKVSPAGALRDINILGNQIVGSLMPGIAVTSTDGLLIKDNTFKNPQPLSPMPNRVKDYERHKFPQRELYLENVTNVRYK